jgi:hypothetical protein
MGPCSNHSHQLPAVNDRFVRYADIDGARLSFRSHPNGTSSLGYHLLDFTTSIPPGPYQTGLSKQYERKINLMSAKRILHVAAALTAICAWSDGARAAGDYPSRPIYGVGERSGIRLRHVVPRISWLLLKGFFWRLREKYVIRDFHPLVFFYALGILLTVSGLVLGAVETILRLTGNELTTPTIVLVALLLISGIQFTLFAMWFDMESNKDLR